MHEAIAALLVPPPNLILFAIAGLILAKWWRRTGPAITTVCLVFMLLLSLPLVANDLIFSLEQGLRSRGAGESPQAIVVLSGETDHVLDRTPDAVVGPLTLEREGAAAALWRRTGLPVLVSGGVLRRDKVAVARLMADSMEHDFGVPVKWVEDRSGTTWENAEDSAAILLPLGIRSVYVVTHAWHERRALMAFRHFGFVPVAAVVQLDAPDGDILPSARAWLQSYYALHEWIGLLWYWVRIHALLPGGLRTPALGSYH
jgi:uncharacterized SAM-binding protein YcdF (DUF218 family)